MGSNEMSFYTIKDIENNLPDGKRIVYVVMENSWIVIYLNNNIRIKVRKF